MKAIQLIQSFNSEKLTYKQGQFLTKLLIAEKLIFSSVKGIYKQSGVTNHFNIDGVGYELESPANWYGNKGFFILRKTSNIYTKSYTCENPLELMKESLINDLNKLRNRGINVNCTINDDNIVIDGVTMEINDVNLNKVDGIIFDLLFKN